MAAMPTMTHFATNGRRRRVAVTLPLVEAIADEAHYRSPPPREHEMPQERRRNMTRRLVRAVLGRDREQAAARLAETRDRARYERAMRRILDDEPRLD
jgi:hypothetical protein